MSLSFMSLFSLYLLGRENTSFREKKDIQKDKKYKNKDKKDIFVNYFCYLQIFTFDNITDLNSFTKYYGITEVWYKLLNYKLNEEKKNFAHLVVL